ncbi:MAG: menaquinone-specific isochorismate synthase, partial [Solirubrobacteraceae bacterium]|nr:menaquinone-specific isochorismate synthase [Solirubrobacteraceae bacterium]
MASTRTTTGGQPIALLPADVGRLRERIDKAIRRARRRGGHDGVLAGLTIPLARDVDPSAVALLCRRPGEPWFCSEQPERDGAAIAALGCVVALEARGPRRFDELATRWRALAREAHCDPPDGPRGAGLIACGGFAFAPDGGASPHWSAFAPASLHVPEAALARRGEEVLLTVAALATPDDTTDGLLARVERR